MQFILGVLNNGGGFYSTEMYFHEARMMGAQLEAPCVNHSNNLSGLEGENTIYMGFYLVRDLEQKTALDLVKERQFGGEYKSLSDFIHRLPISVEQLSLLIRAGAFRFTKKTKQELLWELYRILGNKKKTSINRSLFQESERKFQIPSLDELHNEDAFDQMELFGFPLCSPFDLLAKIPDGIVRANEIIKFLGKNIKVVGYLVTVKNTKTTDGKLMQFGTFVDRFGDWIDTVHFPPVVGRFPFRGKGCYLLVGKVVEEFGYATIEVCEMTKLDYVLRDDNKVAIKIRLNA
jgi:DNA polymerase-3 subunit alpha